MNNKIRLPQQDRGIHTRDKLIVAALELFSEKGYHSTNSKEIAARGEVAIGSFYAYFNDKKELFIEAYKYYASLIEKESSFNMNSSGGDESSDVWKTALKDFSSCGSNRDKIKIIIKNLMKAHNYYPGFIRDITVMRLLDPEIKKVIDDHEKNDISNLVNLVKSIEGNIRVKDAEVAANIIFRTLEVIIHETQSIPGIPYSTERIVNEIADMICRYLFDT